MPTVSSPYREMADALLTSIRQLDLDEPSLVLGALVNSGGAVAEGLQRWKSAVKLCQRYGLSTSIDCSNG